MKIKELKNKNEKELKALLTEKKSALKDFRFGLSGSKARNIKEGKMLRKDIARVMTVMNQKGNK
jgi:ribosomal protein L29